MAGPKSQKTVALFATCLVDLWRPSVARAAKAILEKAGYRVEIPKAQTCCGQPNWNGGDKKGASKLARRTVEMLKSYNFVVVPSGSCADMIKNQYPALFEDEKDFLKEVKSVSGKTFELSEFLVKVAKWKPQPGTGEKTKLTWHDSCSCRRGLGLYHEPRALLDAAGRFETKALQGEDVCCGFGGAFSLKYGEISSHMAGKKVEAIEATGAEILAGADLGCLLNLSGKLKAKGSKIEVRHIAEILAGEDGE